MKKDFLKTMLWMLCAVFTLSACSDDDDKGNGGSTIVGGFVQNEEISYSNNSSTIDAKALTLQYEGTEFPGKDVVAKVKDAKTAELKLKNFFPNEVETVVEVALTPMEDHTGYTFSSNVSNAFRTAFTCEGQMTTAAMTLNVKNVTLAGNVLTEQGTWYAVPYQSSMESEDGKDKSCINIVIDNTDDKLELFPGFGFTGAQVGDLFSGLMGQYLCNTLHSVTFRQDGMITAQYADQFSTTAPAEWLTSPAKPLATYVLDGKDLYVLPHVEVIKAVSGSDFDVETILGLLGSVLTDPATKAELSEVMNRWLTKGVHLTLVQEEGSENMSLKLGDDELNFLRTKILADSTLQEILKELGEEKIGAILPGADGRKMVEQMLTMLINATDMSVSLNLQKTEPSVVE